MADAPWQCSQCGTINEPVANACRTCGHWPSLFDLEDNKLEELPPVRPGAPATVAEVDAEPAPTPAPAPAPAPAPIPMPVQQFPPDLPDEIDEVDEVDDDGQAASQAQPWRRLLRFAVPIAVALYFLISSALNR